MAARCSSAFTVAGDGELYTTCTTAVALPVTPRASIPSLPPINSSFLAELQDAANDATRRVVVTQPDISKSTRGAIRHVRFSTLTLLRS